MRGPRGSSDMPGLSHELQVGGEEIRGLHEDDWISGLQIWLGGHEGHRHRGDSGGQVQAAGMGRVEEMGSSVCPEMI